MYITVNTCKTEVSNKVHASLSIHQNMVYKSRIYLLTCIYFTITEIRQFLIHAYVCTLAIIRTFIVTLLKITIFARSSKQRLMNRIDFHKEEPISRNTDF